MDRCWLQYLAENDCQGSYSNQCQVVPSLNLRRKWSSLLPEMSTFDCVAVDLEEGEAGYKLFSAELFFFVFV